MAVNIFFAEINVNAQANNGSVAIGETTQAGWSTHKKSNYGNGTLFGWNNSINMLNYISDLDPVDSPIIDNDGVASVQNQNF